MPIDQSFPVPRTVAQLSPSTSHNGNDDDKNLETLCRECQRIDWSNITDWRKFKGTECSIACPNGRDTKLVQAFERISRSQLLNSDCHVCRLVASLVNPKSGSRSLNQSLELRDIQLNVCLEAREGLCETWGSKERALYVKLAVRSPLTGSTRIHGRDDHNDYVRFIKAHKFGNHETAGIRMLEPLKVNLDFLRQMLNKCLKDHEECRSTKSEVARLRVIELTTKKICQAPPDCEYIALSYVWGDKSACKNTQGEFPRVIQDAFTVTEALGDQYLWVDQYCIDQNPNSPHMQSMINQMDLVYGNAHTTIVAASGKSSSDSLPGISVPRYQAHTSIGEIKLIEVSNVEAEILSSHWATRGWTYQEWYFSRRRLVFADNEVVFVCNEGEAKETVLGHDSHQIKIMRPEFEEMKPKDRNRSPLFWSQDFVSHIKAYSRRNLSHDCDSLNAFAGILRYYESVAMSDNIPMTHLWGVKLMLLGHPEQERVGFDLLWYHKAISHRRNDLPNWSWSGWGGSVRFESFGLEIQTHTAEPATNKPLDNSTDENEEVTSAGECILRIQIPLEDRTIDLDSFCRERQLNLHREIYPKELHITSFIVPLRIRKGRFYCPEEEIVWLPKNMATFLVRPGIFLGIPVCFDREYSFELHKLGLVLPSEGQFYNLGAYSIIVLHPVADGKYERAGLFTLLYDPSTGDFKGLESYWEPNALFHENDNLISDEDLNKYKTPFGGAPYEYSFLQGAEWKTICLV